MRFELRCQFLSQQRYTKHFAAKIPFSFYSIIVCLNPNLRVIISNDSKGRHKKDSLTGENTRLLIEIQLAVV